MSGETITLRVKFVRQSSSGLARQYENERGARHWIPVSMHHGAVKYPPVSPQHLPVHEIKIEEWWLEKNPWPASKQQDLL